MDTLQHDILYVIDSWLDYKSKAAFRQTCKWVQMWLETVPQCISRDLRPRYQYNVVSGHRVLFTKADIVIQIKFDIQVTFAIQMKRLRGVLDAPFPNYATLYRLLNYSDLLCSSLLKIAGNESKYTNILPVNQMRQLKAKTFNKHPPHSEHPLRPHSYFMINYELMYSTWRRMAAVHKNKWTTIELLEHMNSIRIHRKVMSQLMKPQRPQIRWVSRFPFRP